MNELVRISEFRQIIEDYKLSKLSLRSLSQTKLLLLTAPTSVGRNTIIHELLRTGDYHFIVSDTTRKPRINDNVMEQNGREYWFRSEAEVLADLKQGKYLEAAVIHNQQVSGISIRELERARDESKIAITDADVAGAANVHRLKPDSLIFFVLPPSFDEWQRRIKHRGEMDSAEFARRMQSACQEFETAFTRDYYYFIINDTIENAAQQINSVAKLGLVDPSLQQRGRDLIEQLLLATKSLTESLAINTK